MAVVLTKHINSNQDKHKELTNINHSEAGSVARCAKFRRLQDQVCSNKNSSELTHGNCSSLCLSVYFMCTE